MINGVKALRDIEVGEELRTHYGYGATGPRWYVKLFNEMKAKAETENDQDLQEALDKGQNNVINYQLP